MRAGHLPAFQVPLDEHGLGHVQEEDVGRGGRPAGPPGVAARVAQLVTRTRALAEGTELPLTDARPPIAHHTRSLPSEAFRQF